MDNFANESKRAAARRLNFLLLATLLCYALLIFWRLTDYPIYFFCDEAVHAVEARSIIEHGFDSFGEYYPLFFHGFGDYQLGLSIYLQIPFVLIFGVSELAVRARSAVFSLLGVYFVVCLIRRVLPGRPIWLIPLIFAVTPIWFVHSRTGFEIIIALVLYFGCLLAYVRMLEQGKIRDAIMTGILAAAAFHTYTPARGWVALSIVLLAILNLMPHLRRIKVTLISAVVFGFLMIPYVIFQIVFPERAMQRLASLGIHGFSDLHLETIWRTLQNYAAILHPLFWFTWSYTDPSGYNERHIVPQFAQLPEWLGPFAVVGLIILIWRIRNVAARSLLVLPIIGPFPAALIECNSLRCMPAGLFYLLSGCVGVVWSIGFLARRWPHAMPAAAGAVLLLYGAAFARHVFHAAALLHQDYGFYGVQMGAPQVFSWIRAHETEYPRFYLDHDLFNAGPVFIDFYLDRKARERVELRNVLDLCRRANPNWDENAVFVIPVQTAADLVAIGCPLRLEKLHEIRDPTGGPLFVFAQLKRAPDFDQWIAEQELARRELVRHTVVTPDGTPAEVRHHRIGLGELDQLFDGRAETLVRSAEINPFRLSIRFPERETHEVSVVVTHNLSFRIGVTVLRGDASEVLPPVEFDRTEERQTVVFPIARDKGAISGFELVIQTTDAGQDAPVHVADIAWR